MKPSKKLSVLVVTIVIWYLQQKGVDVTAVVDQVVNTPLDNIVAQVNDSSNDTILKVNAFYIGIQGIIDMIKSWKGEKLPVITEETT